MRCCLALFATISIHAGVIRGVVTEHSSGLPLARSVVRMIPLPGSGGKPLTQRANSGGVFTFVDVSDGSYLLTATREAYFQAAYGQRRPDGQGMPIDVNKDTDLFTDLKMFRKGAVTGRVLDENGVGMPGMAVIAYRARLPLRAEGRAVSDDRGLYRVHGLAPGKYWVRSVAQTLDDGSGRLPTFGREAPETKDALTHRVMLDDDAPFADVRPFAGNLFHLKGVVQCNEGIVTVTLSSDSIHRTTQVPCLGNYVFEGLAPGTYEVLAANNDIAGYIEISLDRDNDTGVVATAEMPHVDFITSRAGTSGPANIPVTILGRRVEFSESAKMEQIKARAAIQPGHWEMTATVGPDQYVETIVNDATARRFSSRPRPADAFDVFVDPRLFARVRVVVSDKAGHVEGSVQHDSKKAPGAPVFLWPVTDNARRSIGGYKTTIADIGGRFHFDGLPPGDYRIFASFDFTEIDGDAVEEARAVTITVRESQTAAADVALWIAP